MPANSFILATKLMAPQLKRNVLLRPRLIESMIQARDRKLIVVCADAGYGKTTLLAQLCGRLGSGYVYYDLDAADNDSARFLLYLVRGLQTKFPGLGRNLAGLVAGTRDPEILVGGLINEFSAMVKDDFYILLDDYHHLQRNLEIAKLLDYLLRHIPANLHLIIASRSRLPIGTHYYESKGELLMLEKEQIRFTEPEIRELFNSVHKLRVSDEDLKMVAEHSAGWITAIQLILQKIIAREGDPPDETIRASLSAGAPVFDYFAVEILEDHPPQIQDFLVRSSVLETIDPGVCDQLLQSRSSRKLLDYITQENVFISRVGQGYRYHPLFRDFLNRRLRSSYPARKVAELYRRLAGMHAGRRDFQAAVDNYILAEDYRPAARILAEQYNRWRDIGAYESYLDLLGRIPASVQDQHSMLLVNKMNCLYGIGNISGVMNNYASILRRLRREKDRKPLIEYLLFMAGIFDLTRDFAKSLALARQAERMIPPRDLRRRFSALTRIGYTYIHLERYESAQIHIDKAMKLADRIGDPWVKTWVNLCLALRHWLPGNLRQAMTIYERLIREMMDYVPPIQRSRVYLNAAIIACECDRERESREWLEQAESWTRQYGTRPMIMDLEYWKGQIRILQSRPADALASFEKAHEIGRGLGLRYPEYLAQASMAQAYTMLGDLARARLAMNRAESLVPSNLPLDNRIDHTLLRTVLEIEENRTEDARRSLEDLRGLLRKSPKEINRMVFLTAQAYFFIETGDRTQAAKLLERALAIADKNGYNYLLEYDCRSNRRLLEFAVEQGICAPYLTRLLPLVKARWGRDLLKRIQAGEGRFDMECSFFGAFTVRDARRHVVKPEWRTRNSKSLFGLLVWAGDKGCSKDQLVAEFWPDQNLKRAGHSLQVEISALRIVLGRILNRAAVKDLIMYRQDHYWLNPGLAVKTDAQEFDRILRQAEQKDLDRRKRAELLKQADELGRPGFCPDLDQEWCRAPRGHYQEMLDRIREELKKLS